MTLRPDASPAPGMEVLPGTRYSSAYQLNPLWERVVKTQRLPPGVDLNEVLIALKHRLRDPEKEVRQHALRVLIDLVPVLRSSLDEVLSPLLPDLLQNLGHSAPAVRKGSLDALRMYISCSDMKEQIISEICSKCLEKNSISDKHQEDVTMGVILALPSLLQPTLGYLGNSSQAIISIIKALSSKLFQMIYQEVAMRSLTRIRDLIGKKVFEDHMRTLDYSVTDNFNLLCNVYDLPVTVDVGKQTPQEINNEIVSITEEASEEFFISEPPSQLLDSENTEPPDYESTITVDVDKTEHIPNGKIILETEISFDSQTAITMTILEEDDNVMNTSHESEDDTFDYTTYNKSVVKVLTDSEVDEYEDVRRTPRRVRFGGEIVKMRTPDSDTIQNSDADEIIEVTNGANKIENVKIVTKNNKDVKEMKTTEDKKEVNKTQNHKSLIPLPVEPITSRPKARKSSKSTDAMSSESKRKSKSLNDLSLYCKQQFGLSQLNSVMKVEELETKDSFADTNKSFIPLKSFSKDDVRFDHSNDFKKKQQKFSAVTPLEDLNNKIEDDQFDCGFHQDDFGLVNSGNSSTGSGSSSDNAAEETFEELNMFNDEIFKDLYKMDGQRGAFQILERLTNRLNNNPDFGPSLDSRQVQVLTARLGTLVGKTRGRAGEAALQALRALVKTASDKSLKGATTGLAGALAGAGLRSQGLLTDIGRRISASDLIEALLDEGNPHWKSTKLRAGALRAVSYAARTLPCSGVRVSWACSRCAACARSPRRRVRAAALDALATLARLCSPRAVLAAVHKEAADHEDGDQLYDAVLARLCRPAAPGATPAIPVVPTGSGNSAMRRPDLAWVMAGVGDASPPPTHKLQRSGDEWIHRARGGSSALEYAGPGHLATPLYTSRITPSAEQWTYQESQRWEASGQPRVLTAPPVTLRPITLPALAPPPAPGKQPVTHAVLWASHPPSQIDIQWTQKQETWPPLGGSWPKQHRVEPRGETWPGRGGHQQHTYSELSPNQQGRWGWQHSQETREDGFSPHEPSPQPQLQSQAHRGTRHSSDGHVYQRHHQYPASAILLTIHNKIDERVEVGSHKSEAQSTLSLRDGSKSPTGSTASLAVSISSPNVSNKTKSNGNIHHTPKSIEEIAHNNSSGETPIKTPSNSIIPVESKTPSPNVSPAHSMKSDLRQLSPFRNQSGNRISPSRNQSGNRMSPSRNQSGNRISPSRNQSGNRMSPSRNQSGNRISPSRNQQPPTIEDDLDDDDGVGVLTIPDHRTSQPSSPHRFINKQESEEQQHNEIDKCDNERFITLDNESPSKDATDNVSVTSAKFSYKENLSRSSAHSVKSQKIIGPLQDTRVTPVRTIVAPAISYMGSSVSTEEEVKSEESGFSEHSVRESLSSEDNGPKAIENVENKTSAVYKKPPKKITRIMSKTVTSRIVKNKIQPTQTLMARDKPFDRPKEVLSKSLVQLENSDWETVMSGLQGMEGLVKFHSVFLESHLTPVCRAIASQIKNLRSQVARAACRLAGNLFVSQRKCIESEADELAVPLLSRTADTNKFLRIDANEALDKMCDSVSPHKSMSIIMTRGTVHQNAIVRCTSARLLGNIANAFGAERMFSIQKEARDRLIQTGADLLTEGSLETRSHAKQLFKVLSQNPHFLRILRDTIPLSKYRSIEKALNNIKAQ